MDKSFTGSILLGSGVISHILARWANQVAFSSSLILTLLIAAMIFTGIVLLALGLWEEFQGIEQNLSTREQTIFGAFVLTLLIAGLLFIFGLPLLGIL